ncbi:MAG TPA: flavin reductase family protein [Acidimicrobiales bacterium]|nr:flavin reductase family protein [Acidimicrobiales bacterium]
MTLDLAAAGYTLSGLRPYPVAITTVADGRANGLISLSAGAGGIVPEAPRVTISLTKYNLTHDLVVGSGVFAMHLLGNDPDVIESSMALIMGLGGSSGRHGDKIGAFPTRPGVTGSPILLDALSYVEGRVVGTLDAEENTIFLADVVGAERLRGGGRLHINEAWSRLPPEWIETYERNHLPQVESARRYRGLVD